MRVTFFIICILIQAVLSADLSLSPIQVLNNPNSKPSLVNSVDFHPTINRFCVTFTHNNSVVLYELDETGRATVFQVLQGEASALNCPQHALFSREGKSLVVANWCNQTFTVYRENENGVYEETPTCITSFLLPTDDFRPHGMAFSPDGNLLAVAFGASKQHPRAVALYQVKDLESASPQFTSLSLVQGGEIERGIPKGVAFSPDGSSLLVTFSETNSVAIYSIDVCSKTIVSTPKQILKGKTSFLSRPEDIKLTADGNYFAISNSNKNNITFYPFDQKNNTVLQHFPSYKIERLSFPHGLAFSSDGNYFAVTQFGPVHFDDDGNWSQWGRERSESVVIYKLER